MTERLTRKAYQSPQTGMERHIEALVDALKNDRCTRSEFAAAIESAMAHAFHIETELRDLHERHEELLTAQSITWSEMTAKSRVDYLAPDERFEFYVPSFTTRIILRDRGSKSSIPERLWRAVRRSAYKKFVKGFREQFEKAYPLRPPERKWR